jgi:xylulose-5-phosphate/fructose-6-phosphate phosphoketolase
VSGILFCLIQSRSCTQRNPHSFRIFSPDELESNKLDAVLRDSGRNFQWDVASRGKGGRVIEVLSEHMCQGMLQVRIVHAKRNMSSPQFQGYTLTGRTGLFPSYESFLGIVTTMVIQYSKFNKMVRFLLYASAKQALTVIQARETTWHGSVGSINYIETSTWTRQEHNGFSHQNPSFIGALLSLKPEYTRIYLPPDANCFLSTVTHCLKNENYVNLMVGSKQPTPVWLTPEEAHQVKQLRASESLRSH